MLFWRKKLANKNLQMPDFLIIGAMKCGTTSLYRYLIQHPQIEPAIKKEIHYFDLNYNKPIQWYLNQFPALKTQSDRITGEATPYYIFHPHAPYRIKEHMPDAKIIVLLRNPVDRAYSHYHYAVERYGETLSFEEALDIENERLAGEMEKFQKNPYYKSRNYRCFSYQKRGIYIEQLEVWGKLFPKEQILILEFCEFFSNISDSMNKVTDFLGVSRFKFQFEVYNQGNYPPMSIETRKRLVEYFKPHNERLFQFLGQTYNWN